MPVTINERDARRHVMRGNADPALVGRGKAAPVQPPEDLPEANPAAVEPPQVVDLTPAIDRMAGLIGDALTRAADSQAQAIQAIPQPVPSMPPRKWVFRITERDRAGNIIAFTAEAAK